MQRLNEEFADLGDDGVFATAVVASYFAPNGQLLLSNAGHPPPFIYRAALGIWSAASRDHETSQLSQLTNLPLGVVAESGFDTLEFELMPGDCIFTYTDGLSESRDQQGNMLGLKGVEHLLNSIDMAEPDQVIRAVLQRLSSNNEAGQRGDDLTVLFAQVSDGPVFASPGQRILGMLKMIVAFIKAPFVGLKRTPLPELDFKAILTAFTPRRKVAATHLKKRSQSPK